MKKIIVNLPDVTNHHYSVLIGVDLFEKIAEIVDLSTYSNIAIITDKNVAGYLDIIQSNLAIKPLTITLEPGEKHKNTKSLDIIWNELIKTKFDRKSLIINLGGGVICDIGGFAASTYMRGIDFINVPTTLLSQVDASTGGKTGIDFANLKNIIGTFQQPKAVIIDVSTLATLPKSELNSGFAEIIKHGLIRNKNYFEKVSSKKPEEYSSEELIEIIITSCEIKKDVVEKDPTEQGIRKILNFGHTIGHAIESLSLETETPLLHGEAISIGMVAEAKMSNLLGFLPESDLEIIKQSFINANLPIKTLINSVQIIEKIEKDKKNSFGEIKWTLLKQIGEATYDIAIDEKIISEALEYIS
ncbi:MAG TPA: 3-dehydroquinate synthase [Candidatus Saccharimonadales bacterium]|nr:3-dehydroquinate synthase [Candidatus Saccharimonadales bacterium]